MDGILRQTAATAVILLAAGCAMKNGRPDGSGTIECTQAMVAPQVAGRIAALPAREGMTLRAGDLVARLDATDYELRRDEAKAALALAEAQRDLVTAGSRDEDIERAKAMVREAEAAERAAAADRKRVDEVFEKGTHRLYVQSVGKPERSARLRRSKGRNNNSRA